VTVVGHPASTGRARWGWLALGLVAAIGTTACADDTSRAADGEVQGALHVFAAASLTDAFTDLAAAFETAHPGTDVRLNLAGSARLREQIRAGAPADVFAPADPDDLAALADAGLVSRPWVTFATNRLRLAVPSDNPGGVAGVADLADPDLLVGLCATGVPCGDLAREALALSGVDPALDTNEPDVRALLTKLAEGELDAGVVYATDVLASAGEVTGIELPPAADGVVATYVLAPVADSGNPATAEAFAAFVRSPTARSILADHGFGPP
jgi:molybdate transport system substrate-binding protein